MKLTPPKIINDTAYRNQAMIARGQRHFQDAIKILKNGLEQFPSSSPLLTLLGAVYLDLGQHEDALKSLTQAKEAKPRNAEAYAYAATALNGLKKRAEALEEVEKALEIDPDLAEAYHSKGNILHERQSQIEEAIACYRKALELRPSLVTAYNDLGVALQDLDRFDEAIEQISKAIERKSDYVAAYLNLGLTYARKGDQQKAIENYEKALELNPRYALALNNLGNLYRDSGNYKEALKIYRKAVKYSPDYMLAHLNIGQVSKLQGKVDEAIEGFQAAIAADETQWRAYENLATTYGEQGRHDLACEVLGQAEEKLSEQPQPSYALANCLHMTGKLDEAIAAYNRAIEKDERFAAAYNDMSVAYRQLGNIDEALANLERCIEIEPHHLGAHLNMGVTQSDLGRPDLAENWYRKALEIEPNYSLALHNLGNILRDRGEVESAIDHYRRCIALNPTFAMAYMSLGIALSKIGKLEEALQTYAKALELNPASADVELNIGVVQQELGDLDLYLEHSIRARNVNPNYKEAYNNMGHALNLMGRYQEAIEPLEKALEFDPGFLDAHLNMGYSHFKLDRFEKAMEHCHRAVEIKPSFAKGHENLGSFYGEIGELDKSIEYYLRGLELRCEELEVDSKVEELGRHLIELRRIPIIYKNEDEVTKTRQHFEHHIEAATKLAHESKTPLQGQELEIIKGLIFGTSNFYLAYQQLNDKDMQTAYSELAAKLLEAEIAPYMAPLDRKRERTGKLRIGVASSYIGHHHGTVWAYNWLKNLPSEDYDIFIYSLNGAADEFTNTYAALGTFKWLPFAENNYLASVEKIKNDELDVLLIPDVGMSQSSKILALLRLATVQCVGWGHPVTTGSPNIDFYLSSNLMEPDNADEHYREKLVRLPNLGLDFDYPILTEPTTDRAAFGLPEDKIIYASVQSLFKYLPRYDWIYPEIAKRVPDALFVFIGNKCAQVDEQFAARLKSAFEEKGVDYEKHVRVLPRMTFSKFMQFLQVSDIYLDSIGWTGGITSMRAIALNLPVATTAGEFMRGRHTSAMLEMIGLGDLNAHSLDELVDLSVKLGQDSEFRAATASRTEDAKAGLFHDRSCIESLDKLFKAESNKAGN